jgi:multimeric flavodoxin WrbA
MITGSAHRSGTTAALARQFLRGAEEAGHQVYRFDAAYRNVHPCIACEKCRDSGVCVFQDDMRELTLRLLEADAVIFASPIYYYAVSAQLKTVIDRFYASGAALHGRKKTALLLAMADADTAAAEGALTSFREMAKYLEWTMAGTVAAVDCANAAALEGTDYPRQAYDLGKNL